jgi:hypothetical protein
MKITAFRSTSWDLFVLRLDKISLDPADDYPPGIVALTIQIDQPPPTLLISPSFFLAYLTPALLPT